MKHIAYLVFIILVNPIYISSVKAESILPFQLPFELPFTYSADISYLNNNNIGRAMDDVDIESDNILDANIGLNYFLPIGNKAALSVDGKFGIEEFTEFSKLSNTEVSAIASFLYQPEISYTALRFRIFLELLTHDNKSDLRDSDTTNFGIEINKRFTTRIQATAGLSSSSRQASNNVFDIKRTQFFINGDYTLNRKIALYLTYRKVDGHVVSTATPTLNIIENNLALAPDDAFGGVSENQIAYRLDASTTIFTTGINYAFDSKNAIDASYEILDSKASGGIYYDRSILNISYLRNF